ncbi:hypothetical protein GF359_06315 [candidate division WOR-3 bacterium]|uniref:TldD/PmbA family protein n=1 Tax=candidate division WOR-3 bacterium TaxID=2052148 RepID=A0A9D5QCL6_UNCW3|nr:hypothetical protein [candidate division WOR-3 bacterium]MBD3364813.1 hypothetical protein [candidate division WOR-3 bacterium]
MNTEWLKEAIERVNKQKKVEVADLVFTAENENLTRFAENRITQNTTRHRLHLTLTVSNDKRRGTWETSDISSRGILSALRKAEAIVKALPKDPEFVPFPGRQRYLKVTRFYPRTAELPVEVKARVIREITSEASSRDMTTAGIYRTGDYVHLTANTNGLFAEHNWTEAEFSITARTDTSSGSAVAHEEDIAKVNPQALAIEAFRTAQMSTEPKELKPGRYKTLISARALGEMMPFVIFQMNRRAADEGRSFFANKLGKKVLAKKINIVADPRDVQNPGSPIDTYNDGIARKKTVFFNEGVLENLWTTRYWARRQKLGQVAIPASISMTGGNKTLDQLIKRIDRGLLVMHLWYIRYVNPMDLILTGTSRDGLFYIENGKIKHSVKHMRFNDSPMRFLRHPSSLGVLERRAGAMMLPSVLVPDFNWASGTTF